MSDHKPIEILGCPVAAARPRVTRFGNTYNPKAKRMKQVRMAIAQQWNREPLDCPISLELAFHMPKPASWSGKRKNEQEGRPHISRPDTDNLLKFTLDCMNGVVFRDDSCVYDLRAIKIYSNEPKTLVKVSHELFEIET